MCIYIYMPLEGFYPPLVGLAAPRAASAITQLRWQVHGSSELNPRAVRWAGWGIRTTWSWPGTGPKTSRRNLLGKPVNLQKNTCEKTHLLSLMWVSWGKKWSCFSVDISGDVCEEHRYIYLYIYIYTTCFFFWSRVFCRKFVWYSFCWIYWCLYPVLMSHMYIYLHFEGHSLITINIRPNIEGSAQLLHSGDLIFHVQGKDSRYERVYSLLCGIRITLWLVNLPPPKPTTPEIRVW